MTERTSIALELAPDTIEQLMDLPMRYVPTADRLLQKIHQGSLERFLERARPVSHMPSRYTIERSAEDGARIVLSCVADGLVDWDSPQEMVGAMISVVGVELKK